MPACCCTVTEMAEAVLRKCSVRIFRLSVLLTDPLNLNFSGVQDGCRLYPQCEVHVALIFATKKNCIDYLFLLDYREDMLEMLKRMEDVDGCPR